MRNKNILYTVLFSVAALIIFTAGTLLGVSSLNEDEYMGIVIGMAMMLLALLFHNLSKLFRRMSKRNAIPYFISYLLNAVGCGFVASSYYTAVKVQAELGELFAAALPAILLVLLCAWVFSFAKKYFAAVLAVFCTLEVALAVFAVYGWITDDSPFFSFLLFSCVFSIFYVIALFDIARRRANVPQGMLVRKISFHSFGIFIIISVIVLFVLSLSDGDGLDIGDVGDIFSGNGKKKTKKGAAAAAVALDVADDALSAVGLSDYTSAKKRRERKRKFQKR